MDPKLSQIPISKILSPKPYTILKGVLLRLLGLGLLTFSIGLVGSISSWAPKIHASRESSHIGVILRLYRDYTGIMEKKMDTSITTISGLGFCMGLLQGYPPDNYQSGSPLLTKQLLTLNPRH